MRRKGREGWQPFLTFTAAAGLAGACGVASSHDTPSDGDRFYDCTTEPRSVPAVPGLARTSSTGVFRADLQTLEPAALVKGNNTWQVLVSDAAGQPLPGSSVKAVPFMPDHGHGTSVKVVVTDLQDGSYRLTPLYLYMTGYWEVTLTITPPAGTSDTVVFPVCIPG